MLFKKTYPALLLASLSLLLGVSGRAAQIANWSGDGNAVDSINANNGTLVNGATYATGKWGQAFSFDGVNDGITIPNSASLNSPHITNAITICAWIKWTGNQNQYSTLPIVRKSTPTNANPYRTYDLQLNNAGIANIAISDGVAGHAPAASSATAIPVNQWVHLAGTYDGQTLRLYVNGTQVGTAASSYVIGDTSGGFCIGRDQWAGAFFGGLIDQVEIWDNALTASEVQARRDFNLPPTAHAGADQIIYTGSATSASVTLDGSTSTDPENHTLTYSWSGDVIATTATTTATLPLGIHMVALTVADEYNQTSTSMVHVAVVSGVSQTGYDQLQTQVATLTAQAITDQATITTLTQKKAGLITLLQSLLSGLDQIQAAATTVNTVSGQQKTAINAALLDN